MGSMVTASLFTGALAVPLADGFPARRVICSGTVTVAVDATVFGVRTGLGRADAPAGRAGNGGRRSGRSVG